MILKLNLVNLLINELIQMIQITTGVSSCFLAYDSSYDVNFALI